MKKTIFVTLLAAAAFCAFAEDLDSLNAQIQRLNAQIEIQRLSAELEQAQETQTLHSTPPPQAAQATPPVVSTATVEQEENAALAQTSVKNEKTKRPRASAGGGLEVGVMFFDASPVKKYLRDLESVQREPGQSPNPLANSGLSDKMKDREAMFIIGGTGYYQDPDNGAIIGGGGYGGFTRVINRVADTVHTAYLGIGYGGFIFGGGWNNERNSIAITSLIGAGGVGFVTDKKYHGSVFDRSHGGKDDDDDDDDNVSDGAAFFALDANVSYMHSFTRWFHAGLKAGALFAYSRRGFDLMDGFATINPSVKVTFVFGNI